MDLEHFPYLNTMLGNLKNALRGRYHKATPKPIPRYLTAFPYRVNRSFYLAAMLPRLCLAAVRTPPKPYLLLKFAEVHW